MAAIAAERLHRITTDVYERMAESGLLPERGIELLDGLVVEMSPKGDRHNSALDSLNKQFVLAARDRYNVSPDSLSLRLGPHDEPEPDIAIARATRSYARERPRPSDLALIVEVANTSLEIDLGEKLAKYARAGIPEYWVVDVKNNVVHVFLRPYADVYAERRTARPGDALAPAEYPDVAIDITLVFGE